MSWSSSDQWPEKRQRADLVTLALIALLVRSGEHVTLLGSGLRPSTGRGSLSRLAALIARGNLAEAAAPQSHSPRSDSSPTASSDSDDLPPVLPLPRHAQVVLISDFLAPLEDLDTLVRRYAERGVKGYLLQILDPAEESLPYRGRVLFEGLQGEDSWLLSRVETVRGAYLDRLEAQCRGIEAIARSVAWGYGRHGTDRPPQSALLTLYTALSQNLKSAG